MSARLTQQQFTLVAIFALFALPLLIAWVAFEGAGTRWSFPTRNHGILIQAPRPVSMEGLHDLRGNSLKAGFWQRHWTLLYVTRTVCNDHCKRALDTMQRVRLALGEDMKRVQNVNVDIEVGDGDLAPKHIPGLWTLQATPRWLSRFRKIAGEKPPSGSIYIIDPQGLQMMFYPPGADPRGVLEDIKRLLKVSVVG